MKVIAVIPAFNEAERIAKTVRDVCPYVDAVVVVDDGSTDATSSLAHVGDTIVLTHRVNRGQGAALRTGTEAAIRLEADVIVHVDGDGQHDPTYIPALIRPIANHEADIVFGSRFLDEMPIGIPWSRRALLYAARTFNAIVMGIPRSVSDPQNGMRAMSCNAAVVIRFTQDRMAHCSEILRLATRSGLRWIEIPVCVRYSSESLSKGQKNSDALTIAWQLFMGLFSS